VPNDDEDLDLATSESNLLLGGGAAGAAGAPMESGAGDVEAGDAHECVICYCAVNPYDGQYMVTMLLFKYSRCDYLEIESWIFIYHDRR
jgi:hypothetical protein